MALTSLPSLPMLSHVTLDCRGMELRDERELKIEHGVAGAALLIQGTLTTGEGPHTGQPREPCSHSCMLQVCRRKLNNQVCCWEEKN